MDSTAWYRIRPPPWVGTYLPQEGRDLRSRRIEPIRHSTYGVCHGPSGAETTFELLHTGSSMPVIDRPDTRPLRLSLQTACAGCVAFGDGLRARFHPNRPMDEGAVGIVIELAFRGDGDERWRRCGRWFAVT